jgi:hypothetical protein
MLVLLAFLGASGIISRSIRHGRVSKSSGLALLEMETYTLAIIEME